MLRLLRRRYPEAQIDFWGSEATADFERALCGDSHPLDWRISWDQPHTEGVDELSKLERISSAAAHRNDVAGPLDLAINCDGFNPLTQALTSLLEPTWVAGGSLRADGRAPLPWGDLPQQRFLADPDWDSPDFLKRYAEQFASNYIAELFCRMAFLEPNADDLETLALPWEEPPFEVPSLQSGHTTQSRENLALPVLAHGAAVVCQELINSWSCGCATRLTAAGIPRWRRRKTTLN